MLLTEVDVPTGDERWSCVPPGRNPAHRGPVHINPSRGRRWFNGSRRGEVYFAGAVRGQSGLGTLMHAPHSVSRTLSVHIPCRLRTGLHREPGGVTGNQPGGTFHRGLRGFQRADARKPARSCASGTSDHTSTGQGRRQVQL